MGQGQVGYHNIVLSQCCPSKLVHDRRQIGNDAAVSEHYSLGRVRCSARVAYYSQRFGLGFLGWETRGSLLLGMNDCHNSGSLLT